jgi:chromosome segregation ATPase
MNAIQIPEQAGAALKEAEGTLAGLEDKGRENSARLVAIAAEKETLAHAALTLGGQAKTKLKELNREAAEIQLEADDLASAIRQARRNVQRAQNGCDLARKRVDASKVLALADEYQSAGEEAHQAFLVAFTAIGKAKSIAQQISVLGGAAPEWWLIQSATDRALAVYQLRSGKAPQLIRDLPPGNQRHLLDTLFAAHAAGIRKRAVEKTEAA